MARIILLVLIIAGVAGYFTRPDEPAMREAANAVLSEPGDISESLEGIGAAIAGERVYSNYHVASRYGVSLDGRTLVDCWGAFTQVRCSRVEQS